MSFETQVFSKTEAAQYRSPNPWEIADPTKKIGWIDDPNNKESGEKPKEKTADFDQAKKTMASNNASEAHDKAMDHPTPDEILAWFYGSSADTVEQSKNSSEWGSKVVEWSASQRENPKGV